MTKPKAYCDLCNSPVWKDLPSPQLFFNTQPYDLCDECETWVSDCLKRRKEFGKRKPRGETFRDRVLFFFENWGRWIWENYTKEDE